MVSVRSVLFFAAYEETEVLCYSFVLQRAAELVLVYNLGGMKCCS